MWSPRIALPWNMAAIERMESISSLLDIEPFRQLAQAPFRIHKTILKGSEKLGSVGTLLAFCEFGSLTSASAACKWCFVRVGECCVDGADVARRPPPPS